MTRRGKGKSDGMIFGILLMLFGGALLLDMLDLADLGRLWGYWPLVVVVYGLVRIVTVESPSSVGGGVSALLFGVWFLVSEMGWNGLHWGNSWPLVFVAIGCGMVTQGILERVWTRGSSAGEVRDDR